LTFSSGYSFQTMNTASKNTGCEVHYDFVMFPKLSNRLRGTQYRKETWCFCWRKGAGISILCCVLTFCSTRKVVQAQTRSFFAYIITDLLNEKVRVVKPKGLAFFAKNEIHVY